MTLKRIINDKLVIALLSRQNKTEKTTINNKGIPAKAEVSLFMYSVQVWYLLNFA